MPPRASSRRTRSLAKRAAPPATITPVVGSIVPTVPQLRELARSGWAETIPFLVSIVRGDPQMSEVQLGWREIPVPPGTVDKDGRLITVARVPLYGLVERRPTLTQRMAVAGMLLDGVQVKDPANDPAPTAPPSQVFNLTVFSVQELEQFERLLLKAALQPT